MKHICAQGPVYLRCVRPTGTGYSWVEEDGSEDDVNNDNEDSDGSENLPDSGLNPPNNTSTPFPLTVSSSSATDVTSNRASMSSTSTIQPSNVLHQSSTIPASSSSNLVGGTVACPTCHAKFPLNEIEQHADQCCERISTEASLYGTWVLDSIDLTGGHDIYGDDSIFPDQTTYDQPQNDMANSSGCSPKELIQSLTSKISDTTQLPSIRRKFLWDDYVNCRKKPWFKKEAWLRIHFVGEEAVDGGGPRREFFTGKVYVSI